MLLAKIPANGHEFGLSKETLYTIIAQGDLKLYLKDQSLISEENCTLIHRGYVFSVDCNYPYLHSA